jgi:hypothetical protein
VCSSLDMCVITYINTMFGCCSHVNVLTDDQHADVVFYVLDCMS